MGTGPEIINIDAKFVLWVAAMSFTIIGILLVTLAKLVISGINTAITNCHDKLDQQVTNHETRIQNIEHAVFKPVGGDK